MIALTPVRCVPAAHASSYDFHRQMQEGGASAKLLKCSEFGQAIVDKM